LVMAARRSDQGRVIVSGPSRGHTTIATLTRFRVKVRAELAQNPDARRLFVDVRCRNRSGLSRVCTGSVGLPLPAGSPFQAGSRVFQRMRRTTQL